MTLFIKVICEILAMILNVWVWAAFLKFFVDKKDSRDWMTFPVLITGVVIAIFIIYIIVFTVALSPSPLT